MSASINNLIARKLRKNVEGSDIDNYSKALMLEAANLLEQEQTQKARPSPVKIAEDWYKESDIRNCTNVEIPDVKSEEFVIWMTQQYRLAMAKGITIGREQQ